ncbi:solute carrier family 22 member 13-like [Haemaphysalis longicornis]
MVGPVFSAAVAGVLADHFGRRPVLVTLIWAFSFASTVSAVANSFFMFLIARLVISATSAAFALLFILLYEETDNEHRAILAFVSSAVVLTLMPPAVHVVSWLQPSWYLAQIFLVAPTVLLAVLSSLIQESPIWLLASGMTQQAEQNILRTARKNGTDLVRAKVFFRALKAHIKTYKEAASKPASWSKTTALSFLFSGESALSAALA